MSNNIETISNTIKNISIDIQNKIFQQYNNEKDEQILSNCDSIVNNIAKQNSNIKAIVSSYSQDMVTINIDGKYIMTYNPIDNLNLLSLSFSVGSIFTVYENEISKDTIVYCAYATYGPTFQFVSAVPDTKVEFLSYKDGNFIHNTDIVLSEKGKINSTAGDVTTFSSSHKELMKNFFDEGYRLRYSGSLSLDTHQILFKKGGLYSSPITTKDTNGTHTLAFELYCISTIVELCGGKSIDGMKRILDIETKDISLKSPVYFGSTYEINKIKTS